MALLICSGDVEAQAATLEALVHAVEDGRIPYTRIEDALKRLRARERAVPGRAGRLGPRAAPAARARLRRASAHRRGDVALPVSRRLPSRPQAWRSHRHRLASQRVRARRVRRWASPSCAVLASSRSTTRRVFAREAGYLAGTPELRAGAFLRSWRDPAVRALIATRGGYGSVQLLPFLDRDVLRRDTQAVHRLQRQHVDHVVADVPVRHHGAARPDAGPAAVARTGRIRRELVHGAGAGRGTG